MGRRRKNVKGNNAGAEMTHQKQKKHQTPTKNPPKTHPPKIGFDGRLKAERG